VKLKSMLMVVLDACWWGLLAGASRGLAPYKPRPGRPGPSAGIPRMSELS